jgi:hypothetical protein
VNPCCDIHSTRYCPDCGSLITRTPGDEILFLLERRMRSQKAERERSKRAAAHDVVQNITANLTKTEQQIEWLKKHLGTSAAPAVDAEEMKRRVRVLVGRGRRVGLAQHVCHFCAKESTSDNGLRAHLLRNHTAQIAEQEASFFS